GVGSPVVATTLGVGVPPEPGGPENGAPSAHSSAAPPPASATTAASTPASIARERPRDGPVVRAWPTGPVGPVPAWPPGPAGGCSAYGPVALGLTSWTMRAPAVGRRDGSLARAAAIGPRSRGGSGPRSGWACRTRWSTAGTVSAPNGFVPVAANSTVAAHANTSEAKDAGAPLICSGAR